MSDSPSFNSHSRLAMREAVVRAALGLSHDMARFLPLLVEFDLSGEWALDGARTCAHWLAERADVEVCTVREWLRVGHALARTDEIARRFAAGRLSYSKVRVLSRVADADNQHELAAIAEDVPAGRLALALARWLSEHETPDDRDRRQRAATSLSWRTDADGMVTGKFRLPPESAAKLTAAIEATTMRAQRERDASAGVRRSRSVTGWPSLAQQRADALVALVTGGGVNVSAEVIFHVRGDGCTLDDGTPIAGSIVERVVPHAFLRLLIHDAERRPINASSRRRHPTTRQKRVVRERDRRCVDCGSTDLLQYDHDPPYAQSHQTVVDELRIRCWRCHRDRHAEDAA